MLLGLHLLKSEWASRVACAINVDNQAALIAISSKLHKSGQHLAVEILKAVKLIQKHKYNNRYKLTLRWTAGHVGIVGNEDMDEEVKDAADGTSLDKKDLPPDLHKQIKHSLSAAR